MHRPLLLLNITWLAATNSYNIMPRTKVPKTTEKRKGVTYKIEGGERVDCLFCNFASGQAEKHLVHEDELCVAFLPLKICAKQHLLIVPKKHIQTVDTLDTGDGELVLHLGQVGTRLLQDTATSEGRSLSNPESMSFIYHRPPHNSIDHLHLHCFELPHTSIAWRGKYWSAAPWCDTHQTVLARLGVGRAEAAV